MKIDLSGLTSSPLFGWALLILGLVLVFVILRFFFHIITAIFRFLLRFIWHGIALLIIIVLILKLLQYLSTIRGFAYTGG
jgi:hypothetical protein